MTGATQSSRRDGIALWRRIADVLHEEIARGVYSSAGKLPAEAALASRFGVNRHTIRRAIAAVAAGGLLRAEQGRGTMVQARLDYPIARRTRFSEIVSTHALSPSGVLIASERVPAPEEIAATLELPAGSELITLETLGAADSVPLSIATHWLPAGRFGPVPEVFRETGSMTKALTACGVSDYTRRHTRITAVAAGPEDACALDLSLGAPILVTESLNIDAGGAPIQLTRARFASGRIQLLVE